MVVLIFYPVRGRDKKKEHQSQRLFRFAKVWDIVIAGACEYECQEASSCVAHSVANSALFLTSITSLLFTFIFISRHKPPLYSGPIQIFISICLYSSSFRRADSSRSCDVPGSETLKSCFLDICVKQGAGFYYLVSCTSYACT